MSSSRRVQRTQQLRRSNAAQPIPSGKMYKRRPKHSGNDQQGENE